MRKWSKRKLAAFEVSQLGERGEREKLLVCVVHTLLIGRFCA